MNYIGIDLSLNSTGIVSKDFIVNVTTGGKTKKGNLTKWHEIGSSVIKYIHTDKITEEDEIEKLTQIENTARKIVQTIILNYPDKLNTKIGIEGYSFNSKSRSYNELIALGTLVRHSLMTYYGKENIKIFTPTEIKKYMGSTTYEKTYTNKKQTKWMYRNLDGVASGSFKKSHIYQAILDNKFENRYTQFLFAHKHDLMDTKKLSVKKPFEDVNDAFCIWLIMSEYKIY